MKKTNKNTEKLIKKVFVKQTSLLFHILNADNIEQKIDKKKKPHQAAAAKKSRKKLRRFLAMVSKMTPDFRSKSRKKNFHILAQHMLLALILLSTLTTTIVCTPPRTYIYVFIDINLYIFVVHV